MGDTDRLDAVTGDETDAVGDDPVSGGSAPGATVAERLNRRGAILPGRQVGGSFSRALALGALWGGVIGAGSVVWLIAGVLGHEVGPENVGFHLGSLWIPAIVVALGALVGAFIGVMSSFGAATAVLLAVSMGAVARWAKALAGATGAILVTFATTLIIIAIGYRGIPTGLLVWSVIFAVVAGATAALTIAIIDSEPRRARALAAEIISSTGEEPAPAPALAPLGQIGQGVENTVDADADAAADADADAAADADTATASADADGNALGAHRASQTRRFRNMAVALGLLSVVSPLWTLVAGANLTTAAMSSLAVQPTALFTMQFVGAAAIPAYALGYAVAVDRARAASRRSADGQRAEHAPSVHLSGVPWGISVLAACTLALTLAVGFLYLNGASQVANLGPAGG